MHWPKLTLSFVLLSSMVGVAHASITWRWNWTSTGFTNGAQPSGGHLTYTPDGGRIRTIDMTYNDHTKEFTFDVLFGKTAPGGDDDDDDDGSLQTPNGFWLNVTRGPRPSGRPDELALFYFDASRSQPVLTAYAFNGTNGNTTWSDGSPASGTQTPDLILSSTRNPNWVRQLLVRNEGDNRRMRMVVDATRIQNHNPRYPGANRIWSGVSFEDRFGITFNAVRKLNSSYNSATGGLKKWSGKRAGLLEGKGLQAVPEPATMAALGLGLAALARRRSKK